MKIGYENTMAKWQKAKMKLILPVQGICLFLFYYFCVSVGIVYKIYVQPKFIFIFFDIPVLFVLA